MAVLPWHRPDPGELVVTCNWCGKKSRQIYSPTQGDDCAASIWKGKGGRWFVQGHYGSTRHDTVRYVFVRNEPSQPADPVCDNCIDGLIMSGSIQEVPGSYL